MNDLKFKLKIYLDNNLIENKENVLFEDFCEANYKINSDYCRFGKARKSINPNIKAFIDKHEQYSDFQTMLFNFIDNKNLKDSDVYNKVHIDRRLFSKIRSDKNYHPSKETIILLGIALELTENELDDLLDSASYSLPKNNKYDLIIRFCFINKIFKIPDINDLLYEYNCKLFSY